MHYTSKTLLTSTFFLSVLSLVTQPIFASSNDAVLSEIKKTINSQGQSAVCEKGMVLRNKSGKVCKDKDIAALALVLCEDDSFQKTDCGKEALKNFKVDKNSTSLMKASDYLEKYTNQYKDKSLLCQVNQAQLQGKALSFAEKYCQSSVSQSPMESVIAQLKLSQVTLEATKTWLNKKPTTTKKSNVTIGSQEQRLIKADPPTSASEADAISTVIEGQEGLLKDIQSLATERTSTPISAAEINKLSNLNTDIKNSRSSSEVKNSLSAMSNFLKTIKAKFGIK